MSIIFGPVRSRRFGISLGVDLSPSSKQCNFDCVYCELQKKRAMSAMSEVVGVDFVLREIENALAGGISCDVLTFTANGEPTLYPHLASLAKQTRELLVRIYGGDLARLASSGSAAGAEIAKEAAKNSAKIPKMLILSNGSRFSMPEVRAALAHFDIVKFSLDAASEKVFKRVDKAQRDIKISQIIDGILAFKREFKGQLVAEVLLVKGFNDSPSEVGAIASVLREIAPSRVDLGTIDRPSAYNVPALSAAEIDALLPLFSGLCVFVPRRDSTACAQSYDDARILSTLSRRPLTQADIDMLFDEDSKQRLQKLVESGRICEQDASGIGFYRVV